MIGPFSPEVEHSVMLNYLHRDYDNESEFVVAFFKKNYMICGIPTQLLVTPQYEYYTAATKRTTYRPCKQGNGVEL